MPQLLIVGAAVVGGWYAWKALKREMARVDREVEAVRKRPRRRWSATRRRAATSLKDKD